MASRRNRDDRPTMIHCEYCGEDYASTYKHCPFCDEMPLEDEDYDGDEDSVRRPRGGKRLVTNTRGGGYGRAPRPCGSSASLSPWPSSSRLSSL